MPQTQKLRPGLGKNHYEVQLIKNLRASLNDHMVRYHAYLEAADRGIILNYYDRVIDKDIILKVYSHPCEDFLQALVKGQIDTLINKSAARLKRNPTP